MNQTNRDRREAPARDSGGTRATATANNVKYSGRDITVAADITDENLQEAHDRDLSSCCVQRSSVKDGQGCDRTASRDQLSRQRAATSCDLHRSAVGEKGRSIKRVLLRLMDQTLNAIAGVLARSVATHRGIYSRSWSSGSPSARVSVEVAAFNALLEIRRSLAGRTQVGGIGRDHSREVTTGGWSGHRWAAGLASGRATVR